MISLILFFFHLLNSIVSLVPIWNLSSASIDLLPSSSTSYSYYITDRYMQGMKVQLKKTITKNEKGINDTNYLIVNDNGGHYVNFENIESFSNYIICPKGKYHPYDYNRKMELVPDNFEEYGDWDLKCYKHDTGYFLVFYLMNNNSLFYSYAENGNDVSNWKKKDNFPFVFDFRLQNGNSKLQENKYILYKIGIMLLEDNYIKIKSYYSEFHEYEINYDNIYIYESNANPPLINLIETKSYNKGIFKNDSEEFYFITYNNISDISSGYSTGTTNDYTNLGNINYLINDKSPFEFIDEVEIKEMNFLLFNKYIYYSIYNKNLNKTYFGIYDVKLNKILFNTDEVIDKFVPYSSNSMLAITQEKAYRICPIKNGEECIEECPSNQVLVLDIDGNKCVESNFECDTGKIILIPENICINYCDTDIYTLNPEGNCGLCKDINNTNPYKIIGGLECLSQIPEGAIEYNYKYGLLKCKDNYHLENGICVKKIICKNQKCLSCSEESNILGLCLTCNENDGFYKVNYNDTFYDCLEPNDPRLEKYYYNETLKEYRPCYKLCKKCIKEGYEDSHNCLECDEGYMFKPLKKNFNICVHYSEFYYIYENEYYPIDIYQCPEEAKFYIREKKSCIDYCLNDNEYIHLFNGDCLKECPVYTIKDDFICKIISEQCYISQNEFYMDNSNENFNLINSLVKSYLYEFNYTNNFVSFYYNKENDYSLYLFKNISCVKELNLQLFEINFLFDFVQDNILFGVLLGKNGIKYLFFNITSGEQLALPNFDLTINNTKIILDAIKNKNISEIISYFNGENIIINEENKIYKISYLSNQFQNSSVVNIGKCEDIIKQKNGLENQEFIIIKTEYNIEEFKIPIIDYIILDQLGNQLNLECCYNTSIEYEIPVNISEKEIYKYDPNSFYYNDICYPVESEDKIDITIYDRKNEYNNNNMALCQTDCTFIKYDSENKKAICECPIINKLPFNDIFEVDKDKLLKSFINIKNILNIDVVKCYKLIFKGNGLLKNYGNYILLCIIFISIISFIIVCNKDYHSIINIIENIEKNKKSKNYEEIQITNKKEKKEKNLSSLQAKRKNKKKPKKPHAISLSKNLDLKNSNDSINVFKSKLNAKEINIEELNDYEKNNLSYDNAKKNDKRTYFEYYISLIKTKQLFAFSFILNTDYNLKAIKVNLFFLTFALNLTVNALFFNDSTMHKIYEDQGNYNFLYQLPKIIYSLAISVILKTILSLLSLTEKNIIKLKECESSFDKYKQFKKCLKIKLIVFFVLEFVFLLAFWYYISCFCALYKNTQSQLINDTLFSFALSLIYPFVLYLIPGFFRIPALNKNNKDGECLYKISKIIQLI